VDDQFISNTWRRPRPEFARQLWQRLEDLETNSVARRAPARQRPMVRAAAIAATILLAVGAFQFPGVRAAARAFLDLFRVVNFAPVAFEPDRFKSLLSREDLDFPQIIGSQVEELKKPGPKRSVASAAAAGAAAGIRVREPTWLPVGMQRQSIEVRDDQQLRVTLSVQKMQSVLTAFGIDDLAVPEAIDGQAVIVHVPKVVAITYADGQRRVALLQAHRPEAAFPAGVDLATLAEIGLRMLGMESSEAHRFAQSVDWHTTLIVPVPADVAVFHQVDVQGNAGLLIERSSRATGRRHWLESRLLWSSGDSVFALMGNVHSPELFEMAQSFQ
jgi:hypothetical protein